MSPHDRNDMSALWDQVPPSLRTPDSDTDARKELRLLDHLFWEQQKSGAIFADEKVLREIMLPAGSPLADKRIALIKAAHADSIGDVSRLEGAHPLSFTQAIASMGWDYHPVDLGLTSKDSASDVRRKLELACPGLDPRWFDLSYSRNAVTAIIGGNAKQSPERETLGSEADVWNCFERHGLHWYIMLALVGIFALLMWLTVTGVEIGWLVVGVLGTGSGVAGSLDIISHCLRDPYWPSQPN